METNPHIFKIEIETDFLGTLTFNTLPFGHIDTLPFGQIDF